VKNVHNHLQVVLPDAEYRDDPMLTTAANNALTLNITVPDGVEATVRAGLQKPPGPSASTYDPRPVVVGRSDSASSSEVGPPAMSLPGRGRIVGNGPNWR